MTDPTPHQNAYAALDTDLPAGVSLSARMAVLESRAHLIDDLRAEIGEHDATIRDAQARRDIATGRLTAAMHAADLLRDIEYSIAPLLGLADRAEPTQAEPAQADPAPTPDGLTDLIGTLEPVTVTPQEPAAPVVAAPEPEAQPTPAPLAEMSEPAPTNTLDLVFPAEFDLSKRARVFLDVLQHPGTTSSSILARTGFKSGPVGGILNAGMQALQIRREGLAGQYTHTLTPSGVAYLRELHAYALTQVEGQDEEEPTPEPEPDPDPTPSSARPRPETSTQARKAAAPPARKAAKPAARAQVRTPPPAAEPDPVSGVSPISQEELKARVRENAAKVSAVLGKKPMTETDLRAKLPAMQLSHLRAALGYLEEAGTLRRVPGPTPASRVAYARDTLELPAPQRDHLTAGGRVVEAHLTRVTDRSERDTISNMVTVTGLPREEVEEALAVLHAQGRLRWSRTGMLQHFTLAPARADGVAA
ncbi:hypothetical protein GCM10008959_25930 [Deinococcus seoulensis]|uniref:MarR family transcriptional regulator n=1 Tax=Deinococcus seoulensis TaxID=1837379 RepID=A0ABQ2RWC8_9DEIO|nr:hypothetical protein [Deinococcus seoulensis]GGR62705.1 hypothetical protein GCM10008959_25930 [Deinococcus seoulensis]